MSSEPSNPKIQARDVKGLKYFKILGPMLDRLHSVGKQRDRADNRQLHMDQYCSLVLMWLYSPIVDSLRGLQQASTLTKVQKRFGISKTSLGSLSESVRIFDPERLKEIAKELGDQLPKVQRRKTSQGDQAAKLDQLSSIGKTITAVDGSIVQVLARIAKQNPSIECPQSPISPLKWPPQDDLKQKDPLAHPGGSLHFYAETRGCFASPYCPIVKTAVRPLPCPVLPDPENTALSGFHSTEKQLAVTEYYLLT
jgi:hypothetical protein